MRAVDIIEKKKQGEILSKEEIDFFVSGYVNGSIEDYQMSAWLMAVCFQGLNFDETAYLTESFINSGDKLDFSDFGVHVADKHSTGGVGDKVTLVLIPLLASLGVACAKLSGRGLGMTGGTIDKLESIKGFNCMLKEAEFKDQIRNINAAISAQTPNLVPADGKIYALRDVTATVDNMSLICASVVSKKIASGADIIVMDVKYGNGAFMKTKEDAQELADLMIEVGAKLNRKIDAVISSMEQPLGKAVGNSLEVIEAIDFLKGKMSEDLYEITVEIASRTLILAGLAYDYDQSRNLIDEAINTGRALNKLKEIITAQGGDETVVDDYSKFEVGKNKFHIKSQVSGYIYSLNALDIAHACKLLGAGRDKKSDSIDFGAGCILAKKEGDFVNVGETLVTLYYNDVHPNRLEEAKYLANNAYYITEDEVKKPSVVAR